MKITKVDAAEMPKRGGVGRQLTEESARIEGAIADLLPGKVIRIDLESSADKRRAQSLLHGRRAKSPGKFPPVTTRSRGTALYVQRLPEDQPLPEPRKETP